MTRHNPRLELTWIGKGARPKLEPPILLEDPTFSHHAAHRVTDRDIFDNLLIHGDNLLALKALEVVAVCDRFPTHGPFFNREATA